MRLSMTILIGKEPRMQTFNLLHNEYCVAVGECKCVEVERKTIKKSKRFKKSSVVSIKFKTPSVLTIPYMKRVEVDKKVLEVQAIQKAISDRRLLLIR